MTDTHPGGERTLLAGLRVLELSDEVGEYCGRLLAGLGADVLKVEPPGGEITRTYGPFLDDTVDPDRSLYFWHYNLGKRSVALDLDGVAGQGRFVELAMDADVVLTSRSPHFMASRGLDQEALLDRKPGLVYARISPFGDDGPWSGYKGSDLVHLALGGVALNCGYDPDPSGQYDTPPIAPQMWLSYAITGEMMVFAINAALYYRAREGTGQYLTASVHDAVSKNTENDVPNWIYLGLEHVRQTCRHSNPSLSPPTICTSKDGRWHLPYRTYMTSAMKNDVPNTARLLAKYGMQADLEDPVYEDPEFVKQPGVSSHVSHVVSDFYSRILGGEQVWQQAQALGLPWAPVRRPEENVADPHWQERRTFIPVTHPDLDRTFVEVGQKWVSTTPWREITHVPGLPDADAAWLERQQRHDAPAHSRVSPPLTSRRGLPFALSDVRIIDLSWLLASGGTGRFLAALGAEVIKVEHHSRPDHARNSWVGRVPATAVDGQVGDGREMNRSGAFNDINAGKFSLSLNLKQQEGLELLRRLVTGAQAVISGFSPGTMERLGLGYDRLRELNPSIVVVEQSAVGDLGTYGGFRGYGPTAQALSGLSEMSGLPEPFPPAGIGYSFLDWYGAYNVANATMVGIYHALMTGEGCRIDASQVEAGIYLAGTSILDYTANGRRWHRYGNRSPYKPGAPHGIYRVDGVDRWIAISCFSEEEWRALAAVLGHPGWLEDERFRTLADRIKNQDALDRLVEGGTGEREGTALMIALQEAGVAAGLCQTARDRCEADPQLKHQSWLVDLPQTDIGTWPVKEAPFQMSATPPTMGGRLQRHGPSYGEDSEHVLSSVLGLSDDEINELRDSGVVGG